MENRTDKISILLVEDEGSIAEGIVFACKQQNFDISWAQNGKDALQALNSKKFSLVILDLGLPDINGLEICKLIRSASRIPILILTAQSSETDKVVGLELGADDYVVKPFSIRELLARIKAILRRQDFSADNPAAPGSAVRKINSCWSHDRNKALIYYKESALALSKYEYNLLLALLGMPGKIFSRSELMDRAWEVPDMSLERTVDSHIKSIRAKLREITKDEVITTHRGFGYSIAE